MNPFFISFKPQTVDCIQGNPKKLYFGHREADPQTVNFSRNRFSIGMAPNTHSYSRYTHTKIHTKTFPPLQMENINKHRHV